MRTPDRSILVIGAGALGRGVARRLLESGRWSVRVLTLRAFGRRASALRALGAEVIPGDLGDVDALRRSLRDCDAVFGLTTFWDHFALEYELGRNLLDAIAGSRVRHLVLSSQPAASVLTGGELSVPQFDIKAQLEREARRLRLPATVVHVAMSYGSLCAGLLPARAHRDREYVLAFPMGASRLATIAKEDAARVVAALFENPEQWVGETLDVLAEYRPAGAYAESLARALDLPVTYEDLSREEYAALGFPGAEEQASMFEFWRRYQKDRSASLARCRHLDRALRGFDDWLSPRAGALRDTLAGIHERVRRPPYLPDDVTFAPPDPFDDFVHSGSMFDADHPPFESLEENDDV